jgi:hypothetical protein
MACSSSSEGLTQSGSRRHSSSTAPSLWCVHMCIQVWVVEMVGVVGVVEGGQVLPCGAHIGACRGCLLLMHAGDASVCLVIHALMRMCVLGMHDVDACWGCFAVRGHACIYAGSVCWGCIRGLHARYTTCYVMWSHNTELHQQSACEPWQQAGPV